MKLNEIFVVTDMIGSDERYIVDYAATDLLSTTNYAKFLNEENEKTRDWGSLPPRYSAMPLSDAIGKCADNIKRRFYEEMAGESL